MNKSFAQETATKKKKKKNHGAAKRWDDHELRRKMARRQKLKIAVERSIISGKIHGALEFGETPRIASNV